ncbi:uncharacterized protein LOC110725977 [Chenopodium quinoa]|uniref:uncharacterized protein LOC110725977 n=1 Tax=Chenopodium quinoa TaxID=63459 RepID=UPI000B795A05|nr:uncharacterized protein LOC110725977 [Chenopodium quinoa]
MEQFHQDVIPLKIPLEKTIFVGQTMEMPYMITTDPLIHILEIRMETWIEPSPEPPELVMYLSPPPEVSRLLRLIRDAYVSSLSYTPVLMDDTIPNLAPHLLPISCMVWNVQGAGSREFVAAFKKLIRIHKPNVIALVETHMGGHQAEKFANTINYSGHIRTDAQGFSGGIWIFWKPEFVTVEPILKHEQHITMNIKRVGGEPWYFSAIYASPDPTKRQTLWKELKDFAEIHDKPWLMAGDFNDTRGKSVETGRSARLDRALCNGEWSLRFPNASTKHLPEWNQSTFHNIFKKKRNLIARIAGVQRALALQKARDLIKLESKLRKELDIVLEQEELLWYQKYRVEWIRDGDRNTTFFHLGTIARRWRNKISAIKSIQSGEWLHSKEDVQAEVVNFFETLFHAEEPQQHEELPFGIFPEFSNRDWQHLSRPFTRCEVDNVINNLGAMKAPGPDGYQDIFYQKNWALVADNVYELVLDVLAGKRMPEKLNDTFLVLIPKVDNPELASLFRPISLCNVAYKIVTKAIVNRIKPMMPHLTSCNQTSFVPGRQITDNIVIVQEVIHTMRNKKGKSGFMAIKIDFEKAYDLLRWDFIRDTLLEIHFPKLLTDIIIDCITSSNMRVLWNGEPTHPFKPSRGVRQGNPLSPYIFVLCMERLNHIIEESIIASGQKTFGYLCEKVDRRLAGWKSKFLSLAGRITLAKSTLNTMANYAMQTARTPRSICDDLDKRTRSFLWGGDEEKRRIHLISWESLQKSRENGGLGLRSTRQANMAFLAKLGWRVLTEPNALWSRVLRSKYCKGRCDIDMFELKANMSNVWKGITESANILCEGTRVVVNDGATTLFWDHRWASAHTLREKAILPIPLDIEGATVGEMWDEEHGWKWNLFADLLPHDIIREVESHELHKDANRGDLLFWGQRNKGKFSIKSALQIIRKEENENNDGMWDLIWKLRVQQRMRVFLRLVMHNRIMCNTNRFKRSLTDDPCCKLCPRMDETALHILRDCKAAKEQWVVRNIKVQHRNGMSPEIWPTYFAIVVWWLWRWRNAVAFDRTSEMPIDAKSFLLDRFEEVWRVLGDDSVHDAQLPRARREAYIKWMAPPAGHTALNSDGSAKGSPGDAGWRRAVKGLHRQTKLCLFYQFGKMLLLQSREAEDYGGECIHEINQCKKMLADSSWQTEVKHIYREANCAADWLANQGVIQNNKIELIQIPLLLLGRSLHNDVVGVLTATYTANSYLHSYNYLHSYILPNTPIVRRLRTR